MENGKTSHQTYTPFLLDPSARFSLWPSNFEGMKAYKDNQDAVWLFRPDEKLCFNNSAVRMAMPEVPEDVLWKD
jgi:branched-chain amino acid aminotransferase